MISVFRTNISIGHLWITCIWWAYSKNAKIMFLMYVYMYTTLYVHVYSVDRQKSLELRVE